MKNVEEFSVPTCSRRVGTRKKKNSLGHLLLTIAAILSLLFAYVYGFMLEGADYKETLIPYLEEKRIKQVSNKPMMYEVYKGQNELISYCGIQKEIGYGGPMIVAAEVDLEGIITNVYTLDYKETRSYYRKLQNDHFFDQFVGMNVKSPFIPGQDVDVVSGATISSIAFTNTIQRVAHCAGTDYLGIAIPEKPNNWKFGIKEAGLLLFCCLAFISMYKKNKILRSITLVISFVYLGFYLNSSLSVSSFGSILLGYFPSFKSHLIWWILVGMSIGSAVLLKKNVYCSTMCPFHAAQKGLIYISGMKFRLPAQVQKVVKHTSKFLLWASLMLIFIAANPTLAAFEPFAMLFSLDGIGVQWYILPASLVGSLFISDFFCQYFCPVGRTFTYLIKLRKQFDSLLIQVKTG